MSVRTGLDRLLADPTRLVGRRYGLLAHGASISRDGRPIHLALAESPAGPPAALFGPEHGYYGVEQDMIAAASQRDPWTGAPIHSLYGDSADTLRPSPSAFAGLDLLVIDLQDVGSRYYTYAATGIWAAEAAMEAGCEVWVLDRPNPLGGDVVEGNLLGAGYESFVGAFRLPVRHGLTLGELFRLEARRREWNGNRSHFAVWYMEGWERAMTWEQTGLPWIAPSPNMPTILTALVYPGGCLVEATELSEGRGTARPFQLTGAPFIDPKALAGNLNGRGLPGVAFVPTYYRPQFQKHRGAVCGGVELLVTDAQAFESYRTGVELLDAIHRLWPQGFAWREAPYEFVSDRPAIDLLTGGPECRQAIESGEGLSGWIATWKADEAAFREERRGILLYPEVEA
ncbi:MAG: exo-beta-N-acetylmuramidase NamZ domain-containing protein [Thermoanaerobaculia bacterium]